MMIESEKQQKQPGFQARIGTLTKVKEQAKLLSKVTKGNIEKLKSIPGKDKELWHICIANINVKAPGPAIVV